MDFNIRRIQEEDCQSIVEIDAYYSREAKPEYWEARLTAFTGQPNRKKANLGYVAVTSDNKVIGYILAETRAWEFGSPPCGWIFAVSVDPKYKRHGIALSLCREVYKQFKSNNIKQVRTMVRRDDLDILSFFRSSGFRSGPFIELELEI